MRNFRTVALGLLGILISVIGYSLMVTYTQSVYGLVVSLLGSLAGAHAVLGYLGKEKIKEEDFGTISKIGVAFAFLGSVAPFILYAFGVSDIIFIAIGTFGGYEFAQFLYRQHLDIQDEIIVKSSRDVRLSDRMKIYSKKILSIVSWYLIFAFVFILMGTILLNGFGVSWVLLVVLVAYEIWHKKVFIITDEDLKSL